MTVSIVQQPGQSIFDLALQGPSTLDQVISLAVNNGVSSLNSIPQQVPYVYDDTLVKYEGNTNVYATDITNNRFFDPNFFDSSFFQ